MCRAKSDASGQAREPAGKASEPTALFPGSQCPPPSHFWKVALASPANLAPAEREHLDRCPRCREYFERVLHAVQCPKGAEVPAPVYNKTWAPARRAEEVAPLRREAGGG